MPLDHRPTSISDFLGLYSRGDKTQTPPRHQLVLDNFVFEDDLLRKRGGFEVVESYSRSLQRFTLFNNRPIYTDGEYIYDGHLRLNNDPLIGATDFTSIEIGDKLYIAPNKGPVQVYDGVTMRPICGEGPPVDNTNVTTASLFYPVVAATGDLNRNPYVPFNYLDVGDYLIGISYQIGNYISPIGYVRHISITSLDYNKVVLNNIPEVPTNVDRIVISMTRLFATTDQYPEGRYDTRTFYFVPFGVITVSDGIIQNRNDNITIPTVESPEDLSIIKYVMFQESLLLESSYLIELETELRDIEGCTEYNNRLILWKGGKIYVSRKYDHESFSKIDGFIDHDRGRVTNCFGHRDVFYVCEESTTYATADNDEAAGTWPTLINIDRGLGAHKYSVGSVLGFDGPTDDYMFIGNKHGLCLFNGIIH